MPTSRVILDAGPLGKLAHHRATNENIARFERLKESCDLVAISEAADYEVRRNLILHRLQSSVEILDYLVATNEYIAITTKTMHRAAQLWAESRRRGRPTSYPGDLSFDAILAAQAEALDATVLTENVRHLSRYVDVLDWNRLDR